MQSIQKRLSLAVACLLCLGTGVSLRAADEAGPPARTIPDSSYTWWREARFGIFIHWNPSSVLELGEGSWSRKNPTDFDAAAWARTFKQAGAGYVVFTAKHHDGFCMFDSRLTDYDIMSTPYGRDIARELSAACRREGIEVIWYYSRPDWFDPRHDVTTPGPYVDYLTGQITELLTNYGRIGGIWWDSGQIEVPTRPRAFDTISLREKFNRIRGFRIEIQDGDTWRTIHEGRALDLFTLSLPEPVTARKIRLVVTDAVRSVGEKFQGPGIQEFDLYPPRD